MGTIESAFVSKTCQADTSTIHLRVSLPTVTVVIDNRDGFPTNLYFVLVLIADQHAMSHMSPDELVVLGNWWRWRRHMAGWKK